MIKRTCAAIVFLSMAAASWAAPRQDIAGAASAQIAVPHSQARPACLKAQQTVTVMVELDREPAIPAYLGARDAARAAGRSDAESRGVAASKARIAELEKAQAALFSRIRSRSAGAEMLYGLQRTYNGMVMRVRAADVATVAGMRGVKAVHPMQPKYPQNSTSVPFIGVTSAWQYYAYVTGEGVKLGILDTGVDYIHAALGGSGNTAQYAANDTTDPSDIADYPNTRVVGGTDLVGDDYNGENAAVPDDDPMDANGHGTHVAGTAAGWAVTTAGLVYSGPWDDTTPFDTFRVGCGVAPNADIYGVKIFGASGSTWYVPQGIEWTTDPDGNGDYSDRMDVVNCSVGSPYGVWDEPDVVAMNNAVALGVFYACSAGNSGDAHYINGSPGIASRACSTASGLDMHSATGLRITSPLGIAGDYACQPSSIGPALDSTGFSGNIVMAEPADAASALTNAAEISGNIALIDRGSVDFLTKVANAQDAGATAVIVANNLGDSVFTMSTPEDDSAITIPSAMIGQSDGTTIKGQLPGVACLCTMEIELRDTAYAHTMSYFSSRGPCAESTHLKPDITAPGSNIMSAAQGSGVDVARFSGTSMASPHIAGAAALMRELYPHTCQEVKALLMNGAHSYLYVGTSFTTPTYGTARVGAGMVGLTQPSTDGLVAYCVSDQPGAVGICFGAPEIPVGQSQDYDAYIVLDNKGTQDGSYTAAYSPTFDAPGIDISFPDGATVNAAAGTTASLRVRMSVDADQLRHVIDPSLDASPFGYARHWVSEESGTVVLSGYKTVNLPLYAAPRPVANLSTGQDSIDISYGTGCFILTFAGAGLANGTEGPYGYYSWEFPFELTYIDEDDAASSGTLDGADIRYVGVNVPESADIGANEISFGVALWKDLPSPNMREIDIEIDYDRDGTFDLALFTIDYGSLVGADPCDIFTASVFDYDSQIVTAVYYMPAGQSGAGIEMNAFNTNVASIWVANASILGITEANPVFNYRVSTYYGAYGQVDITPTLTYDAANQGLYTDNTGLSIAAGTELPVYYDLTNFTNNNSRGLLIMHPHNASGNRTEVLFSPPAFQTTQSIDVESTGRFWVAVWDYGAGAWGANLDGNTSGQLDFTLGLDNWLGIFLYDYSSTSYEEGAYVYRHNM